MLKYVVSMSLQLIVSMESIITSMDLIDKLSKNNLVVGMQKPKVVKDKVCDTYQNGKQVKTFFKIYKHCIYIKAALSFTYGLDWSIMN